MKLTRPMIIGVAVAVAAVASTGILVALTLGDDGSAAGAWSELRSVDIRSTSNLHFLLHVANIEERAEDVTFSVAFKLGGKDYRGTVACGAETLACEPVPGKNNVATGGVLHLESHDVEITIDRARIGHAPAGTRFEELSIRAERTGGKRIAALTESRAHFIPESMPAFTSFPADRTLKEGESLEFTVIASNYDGGNVTYAIAGAATASKRMILDPATGSFAWDPIECGRRGSQTLDFSASVGDKTVERQLALTIEPINCPPRFLAKFKDSYTVPAGGTLRFNAFADDIDGDALTWGFADPAKTKANHPPPRMVHVGGDGNEDLFRFRPTSSQVGEHRVDILVSDGVNPPRVKTVTITVTKS